MGVIHGPLPPPYVTDGLIFHIDSFNTDSYPGSGTDWNSLINANNNGELENAAMFVTPNMTFNNTNQYAKFPQPSGTPIIGDPFSVDYWFYQITTGGETVHDGCIAVGLNNGNSPCFFIKHHWQTVPYTGKGWYYYYPRGVGNAAGDMNFNGAVKAFINLDAWNHIALTQTGASWVVYHNGVDQGAASSDSISAGPTSGGSTAGDEDMYVGNAAPGFTNDFHGMIDIMRVYNRVLTGDEVIKNFDAEKSRFGL